MSGHSRRAARFPDIKEGIIQTIKADVLNHGFGLKSIRDAASAYDGELSLDCIQKPYGYEFLTEILFPIEA